MCLHTYFIVLNTASLCHRKSHLLSLLNYHVYSLRRHHLAIKLYTSTKCKELEEILVSTVQTKTKNLHSTFTQEHMIKTTTSGYTAEWLFFLKVING